MAVSAVPAMAQDDGAVTISGSVHMNTYWRKADSTLMQQGPAISSSSAATTPSTFSDTDLFWNLDGSGSTLNFNFKQGDLSGRITLRPGSPSYWYGTWNFGAGQLTIGNASTPTTRYQASLSVWTSPNHWSGAIDPVSRNNGIQLAFPLGGGTLKLAANQQASHTLGLVTVAGGAPAATTDTDQVIPKLEASYDVRMGGFHLWVAGGYQTYSEVVTSTDKEYDVDSWLLGIYGSYGFGPVTVNASIHRMQNPLQYGMTGKPVSGVKWIPNTANATYDSLSDSIIDADFTGWHLSVGWKISDMLTLQAGYGHQKYERDLNPGLFVLGVPTPEVTDVEDDAAMYYINMPIFAAKGFTITPEIGVQSEEDAKGGGGGTIDQGKTTYYGAKWLIRF